MPGRGWSRWRLLMRRSGSSQMNRTRCSRSRLASSDGVLRVPLRREEAGELTETSVAAAATALDAGFAGRALDAAGARLTAGTLLNAVTGVLGRRLTDARETAGHTTGADPSGRAGGGALTAADARLSLRTGLRAV